MNQYTSNNKLLNSFNQYNRNTYQPNQFNQFSQPTQPTQSTQTTQSTQSTQSAQSRPNIYINPMASPNNSRHIANTIREPNFYNRLHELKIEQIKKAKSINDLNVTRDQLIKYVICPFKEEKQNIVQFSSLLKEKELEYPSEPKIKSGLNQGTGIGTGANTSTGTYTPKILTEWWDKRTNVPYKNILKQEDYTKKFTTKEDLIVYKVSSDDKNRQKLESELNKLKILFEKHNSQLKLIFSASEENKHKEEFEYVHKITNKVKFDPKNCEDLKNYYKKEQKKMSKENKRIDEMIELLLDGEELTKEDLIELSKQDKFTKPKSNQDGDLKLDLDLDLDLDLLEKKLKKDLGTENYNNIVEEFNKTNPQPEPEPKPDNKNGIIPSTKSRIKISTKTKSDMGLGSQAIQPTQPTQPAHIDDTVLSQYMNRQKKT